MYKLPSSISLFFAFGFYFSFIFCTLLFFVLCVFFFFCFFHFFHIEFLSLFFFKFCLTSIYYFLCSKACHKLLFSVLEGFEGYLWSCDLKDYLAKGDHGLIIFLFDCFGCMEMAYGMMMEK